MIVKCTKCHHEWQTVKNDRNCDWCDAPGKSIESDYMSDADDDDWPGIDEVDTEEFEQLVRKHHRRG